MPVSVGDRTIDRLRTALAMRAVTVPDGAAEDALEALGDAALGDFEPRWAEACERLGLDGLSGELLLLAVAPELDARCGAAYAALHGGPLATMRGLVSLLTADGARRDDVLAGLDAAAPLRRGGALVLLDAEGAFLDRPLAPAPELVSFLLATTLEDDAHLRRTDLPGHPLGRADAVARIRAALAIADGPPLLVNGPDAAELVAVALERGVLLADA